MGAVVGQIVPSDYARFRVTDHCFDTGHCDKDYGGFFGLGWVSCACGAGAYGGGLYINWGALGRYFNSIGMPQRSMPGRVDESNICVLMVSTVKTSGAGRSSTIVNAGQHVLRQRLHYEGFSYQGW
ncbi:hypothetical protein MTO96_002250 [Rhipicephalus appendiculatus]